MNYPSASSGRQDSEGLKDTCQVELAETLSYFIYRIDSVYNLATLCKNVAVFLLLLILIHNGCRLFPPFAHLLPPHGIIQSFLI